MKKVAEYLPSRHWLMKSEPDVFSFDDLLGLPSRTTFWEGVRNYQARNFMMKEMVVGDKVLFYHSNANPSGIVGLAEVVAPAKPDVTALDPGSKYFDAKATEENPQWYGVSVGRPRKLSRLISLEELKVNQELQEMLLIRKGQRLSILPVSVEEYRTIIKLA
jgi:predicted RNA-binding protein with PUA-like domain